MKYPTQKQVSSKVAPMSQQISKRQPPQFNKEKFNQIYDEAFLKSYKEDKLFHHSLKKMNCTLPKYFNDLYITKELSKRIIFLQSPSFNGINYIIQDIKDSFVYEEFKPTLQKEDQFENLLSLIEDRINNQLLTYGNQFVLIQDFPLELYNMVINNTTGNRLYHQWIDQFKVFIEKLKKLLDSKNPKVIVLFWWEDNSIDNYILDKIFKKEIITHKNTEIIIIKQVTNTKLKAIISEILHTFFIFISMNNTKKKNSGNDTITEKLITESKGNLLQLKEILFYFIQNYKKNNRNLTNKSGPQNKEEIDRDIFHLLGKILYNKRIDPRDNKKIRQMTKKELTQYPYPKLYFKIQDIIDASPLPKEEFNNLLIEGAFSHFKDIGELADATDSFSFTNTMNKFHFKLEEKNFPLQDTIENMKFILNGHAITAFNLSQYDCGKSSFHSYKKSIYHYKILFNYNFYYECIENNASVFGMGKKKFMKEVEPYYRAMKKQKKQRIDINGNNELNDYDLDRIKNEKKENNSFVEEERRNYYIKKEDIIYDNDTHIEREKKKIVKVIGNKQAEQVQEMQNIIDLFASGDEESELYDSVDED